MSSRTLRSVFRRVARLLTVENLVREETRRVAQLEDHVRALELQLQDLLALVRATEERTRSLDSQGLQTSLQDLLTLVRTTEERTRSLEYQGQTSSQDLLTLARITEERTRSLEYQGLQTSFTASEQLNELRRWYVESAEQLGKIGARRAVSEARALRLQTDHPIALGSQDHLVPDSTAEGLARPTSFVAHCIEVAGRERPWLDLGTGAAGFVFEAVMQDVVALGVDGSDHCRKTRVGYWPLMADNLRTCDITHPFRFVRAQGTPAQFGLVTMWEVLEHIPEANLPQVLQNVAAHLAPDAYFIGSISLLEYMSADGVPYHVTLKPREWWAEKFRANGLEFVRDHPFDERLFYRGNGPRFQDYHNYVLRPDEGFHFVARLRASSKVK